MAGVLQWLAVGLGMGDSRKDKPTGLQDTAIKGDLIADQTAFRGGFCGTECSKAWLSAAGSSHPAGITGAGISGATVFSTGLSSPVRQLHQVDPYRAPAAEFEFLHLRGPGESERSSLLGMSKRDTNLLPQSDTSLLPPTHLPPASTLGVFSSAKSKFRLKEAGRCKQPEKPSPE